MDPSGFCALKGFWGPKTLDFNHLNTLFPRKSVCVFLHSEQLLGALQRKEMAPTLKTLFYNAF